jgi:hypothetical protein
MRSVMTAVRAELAQLKTIRGVPAVLLGDVVTVFANRARQSDLRADIRRLLSHFYPLLLAC